jgi:DNA-binding NarL/FixJ family response regulator
LLSQIASAQRTLIIAEELVLFRDSLAALCESSGLYRVVGTTSDGDAAWELIERFEPGLALIDLAIPGLYSLEIAKRLAEANPGRKPLRAKCVLLAGRGDRKSVLEALRAGAQGFLLKNSTREHLFDCIQQVLEGGVYVSPTVNLHSLFNPDLAGQGDDPLARLSSREYQVFSMLVEGVRAKEIAARLSLSPKTVDTYRANLMKKLDIHDVPSLVKFAIHRRLIPAG